MTHGNHAILPVYLSRGKEVQSPHFPLFVLIQGETLICERTCLLLFVLCCMQIQYSSNFTTNTDLLV